ncbi:hypothetical protein [Paenibacillus sp. GXUN7292]|uniref:hypothetical protein n=1 Tax=Paenibacillus sp. GXUN7292 TaxID=3422499 RepID=UPI003D7D5B52
MGRTLLLAALSLSLVCMIIIQPDASFQASLQGLGVWWNIVFPGLLPFLILFEIMLAFGLIRGFATLSEPAIRRCFKLPGTAAVPIAIGWFGGFPAGSDAAMNLMKRGLLNKSEAARTMAIAHMPSPLFVLVIVGSAFLKEPITGIMILAAIWLSGLWMMFSVQMLLPRKKAHQQHASTNEKKASAAELSEAVASNHEWQAHIQKSLMNKKLLHRAAAAMRLARLEDGRSFGKVLGDAVAASVQKLLVVGGFMIFAAMVAKLCSPLFQSAQLPYLGQALLESHLGAHAIAANAEPGKSLALPAAIIAAALSWSGISGILQASYTTFGSRISIFPFVLYRILHAAHAFLFTIILWKPLSWLLSHMVKENTFPVVRIFTEKWIGQTEEHRLLFYFHDLPYIWQLSLPFTILAAGLLLVVYTILLRFLRAL